MSQNIADMPDDEYREAISNYLDKLIFAGRDYTVDELIAIAHYINNESIVSFETAIEVIKAKYPEFAGRIEEALAKNNND